MSELVLPRKKLARPDWLRIRVQPGDEREKVRALMSRLKLHTVCASAQCPNLCECFHHSTATYLILGNECTRDCKFCAVPHNSHPAPPDPGEPERVALEGDIDSFTNMLWSNLNEANKISLFVRYTDIQTGEFEQRIINKHQ